MKLRFDLIGFTFYWSRKGLSRFASGAFVDDVCSFTPYNDTYQSLML